MPTKLDITGQRFGRLLAVKPAPGKRYPNGKAQTRWLCRCDCGVEIVVPTSALVSGHTKSCGCYKREVASRQGKATATHGGSHSRLWNIYRGMLARCYNPNTDMYHAYGAKGVTVCKEWKGHFDVFREWALTHGYDENAPFGKCTIDRIDVTKGYAPNNCRWCDSRAQQRNRRDTIYLTVDGIKKPLVEWAEISKVPYTTLKYRLRKGWTEREVLYGKDKTDRV